MFIAMVLVAAIAAGVLINTAGFLQSKSQQTGEQSSQQVTNRLDVISTTGEVDTSNNVVISLNMTVKKAPGAADINLDNVTIQWIGPDGSQNLIQDNENVENSSKSVFQNSTIKDADDSQPVLNSPDDRFSLDVQLNQPEAASGNLAELEEGETATLKITTQSDGTTEVRIQVPQSVGNKNAIEL